MSPPVKCIVCLATLYIFFTHFCIFGPGPAGTQQADIHNLPYHITPSHMFVIHTFATRWQAWTSLREQRVYSIKYPLIVSWVKAPALYVTMSQVVEVEVEAVHF